MRAILVADPQVGYGGGQLPRSRSLGHSSCSAVAVPTCPTFCTRSASISAIVSWNYYETFRACSDFVAWFSDRTVHGAGSFLTLLHNYFEECGICTSALFGPGRGIIGLASNVFHALCISVLHTCCYFNCVLTGMMTAIYIFMFD